MFWSRCRDTPKDPSPSLVKAHHTIRAQPMKEILTDLPWPKCQTVFPKSTILPRFREFALPLTKSFIVEGCCVNKIQQSYSLTFFHEVTHRPTTLALYRLLNPLEHRCKALAALVFGNLLYFYAMFYFNRERNQRKRPTNQSALQHPEPTNAKSEKQSEASGRDNGRLSRLWKDLFQWLLLKAAENTLSKSYGLVNVEIKSLRLGQVIAFQHLLISALLPRPEIGQVIRTINAKSSWMVWDKVILGVGFQVLLPEGGHCKLCFSRLGTPF